MGKIIKLSDENDKFGQELKQVPRQIEKRGRPKSAKSSSPALKYLKSYCGKFNSWDNYISSENILQTGRILTLEFVGRAFDENNKKANFGPSLALFYALADAFIESENNDGDGFKQWSSAFLEEDKTNETTVMHSLVKKCFRKKYDFRLEGKAETEWGVYSKNGLDRRVEKLFKSDITARFLVKLFDARVGTESAKLRLEKLGRALAEKGRRLEGDKRWHAVFNQRIVLPKSLKDRGYIKAISAETISEENDYEREEVMTDDDDKDNDATAETAKAEEFLVDEENLFIFQELKITMEECRIEKEALDRDLKRIEDYEISILDLKRLLPQRQDDLEELKKQIVGLEKATGTTKKYAELAKKNGKGLSDLFDFCNDIKSKINKEGKVRIGKKKFLQAISKAFDIKDFENFELVEDQESCSETNKNLLDQSLPELVNGNSLLIENLRPDDEHAYENGTEGSNRNRVEMNDEDATA